MYLVLPSSTSPKVIFKFLLSTRLFLLKKIGFCWCCFAEVYGSAIAAGLRLRRTPPAAVALQRAVRRAARQSRHRSSSSSYSSYSYSYSYSSYSARRAVGPARPARLRRRRPVAPSRPPHRPGTSVEEFFFFWFLRTLLGFAHTSGFRAYVCLFKAPSRPPHRPGTSVEEFFFFFFSFARADAGGGVGAAGRAAFAAAGAAVGPRQERQDVAPSGGLARRPARRLRRPLARRRRLPPALHDGQTRSLLHCFYFFITSSLLLLFVASFFVVVVFFLQWLWCAATRSSAGRCGWRCCSGPRPSSGARCRWAWPAPSWPGWPALRYLRSAVDSFQETWSSSIGLRALGVAGRATGGSAGGSAGAAVAEPAGRRVDRQRRGPVGQGGGQVAAPVGRQDHPPRRPAAAPTRRPGEPHPTRIGRLQI